MLKLPFGPNPAPQTRVETQDKPDKVMDWGPWGPPQPVFNPPIGPLPAWIRNLECRRTRSRIIWRRWRDRTLQETCELKNSLSGDPNDIYDPGLDDGEKIAGGFWWKTTWEPVSDWENHAEPHPDEETETVFFDPPDQLFDWSCVVASDIVRGMHVSLETDWLRKLKEVASFAVRFDGEKYPTKKGSKPQRIDTKPLAGGTHIFDLHVELTNGTSRDYVIMFSVVDPIEAWFERPIIDVTFDDLLTNPASTSPNGAIFDLVIANNAAHDVLASVQVGSVPSGWKAVVVGPAAAGVAAGGQTRVKVVVEAMTDMALSGRSPIPIVVYAYTGRTKTMKAKKRASATCCVQPILSSAAAKRLSELHARLEKVNVPRTYR